MQNAAGRAALIKSKFVLYAASYRISAEANISANIDFGLLLSYSQEYLYVSNWQRYYIFSLSAVTSKISPHIFEIQYCVSVHD
jgi:hypothetical protein